MTTIRKIMTAIAALAIGALSLNTAPANAGGFAFQFGGPVQIMGDNDMPDQPQVHFQVQLGGPDIMDDEDTPPPMSKAEIEQAAHQCEVVKKIEKLIVQMKANLPGMQKVGLGLEQAADIGRWERRLEETKRDCAKLYV